MQIFVLGMHRSGTSMVARLINMMGAYFGADEDSTGANPENPKGFWERKDLRNLNDNLLHCIGAEWDRISKYQPAYIPASVRAEYLKGARNLLHEMDKHRPWILKEPRLCLFFDLLKPLLEIPVCVHVYRSPVQVARSLFVRNKMPMHVGVALWEKYNVLALKSTANVPRTTVRHAGLIHDPLAEVEALYNALIAIGAKGLELPGEQEILSFIDKNLYRATDPEEIESGYLNEDQRRLIGMFPDTGVLHDQEVLETSAATNDVLQEYEKGYHNRKSLEEELQRSKERFDLERSSKYGTEAGLGQVTLELKDISERYSNTKKSFMALESEHKKSLDELEGEREINADLKRGLADIQDRMSELESKYRESLNHLQSEREVTADLTVRLTEVQEQISELDSKYREGRDQLQSEREVTSKLNVRTEDIQHQMSDMATAIAEYENELRKTRETQIALIQENSRLGAVATRGTRAASQLQRWMDQISGDVKDLQMSWRWRIGNSCVRMVEKLKGSPSVPIVTDHLNKIVSGYQEWKVANANEHAEAKNHSRLVGDIKSESSEADGDGLISSCFPEKGARVAKRPRNVLVILYISGACEATRRCLLSLRKHTPLDNNFLYIVDDSQKAGVAEFICALLDGLPIAKYIKHAEHLGFYKGVHSVIREAGVSDYCVVRETVVVARNWLPCLQEAAYSSSNAGLASPVTATHPYYSFSMNPGDNVYTCSEKLSLVSHNIYPLLPIPDPNIFYIRGESLKKVPFPGQIEDETEKPLVRFAVELLKKKRVCVLADDVFAYVSEKSNPYPELTKEKVVSHVYRQDLPIFDRVVRHVEGATPRSLRAYKESDIRLVNNKTLGVVFSSMILRGGVLILTELANDLILKGVDVKAFLMNPSQREYKYFDILFEPVPVKQGSDIVAALPRYSNVMATFWATVPLTEEVIRLEPSIKGFYFMQDFEVLFYDPDEENEIQYYEGAAKSYFAELEKIATSDWIIEKVRAFADDESLNIHKINVGINLEVFRSEIGVGKEERGKIRVLAMARPETPRRGFDVLVKAFSILNKERDDLEFALFGSNDLESHKLSFEYTDLGCIAPEQLRKEYQEADIFVDASNFQGFGLAPLEAMACGCASVVTDSGGVREYVRDGENSLVVPACDSKALAKGVARLVEDVDLRGKIEKNAIKTVREFSNHNLAAGVFELLERRNKISNDTTDSRNASGKCNIIVPVYNEVAVARICLESIVKYTEYPYRLLILDDGSDSHCAEYLRNFAEGNPDIHYLRNHENLGFIGSVNRGMAETDSGDIVLLNSDTIVTPGWLGRMTECAGTDRNIGIVSPLSTRSSHLWLKLNPGDSIFDASRKIAELSTRTYPDVITPEGWCFYIKRQVYELLGGFDEVYGRGYCEESDYCMQAYANGYRLVCCDDAFIYHEGMVTFKEERGERYRHNRKVFDRRWKPLYEKIYQDFLNCDPLKEIRIRYRQTKDRGHLDNEEAAHLKYNEVIEIINDNVVLEEVSQYERQIRSRKCKAELNTGVVFLLSVLQPYGGVISVVQLVNDLLLQGVNVKVVVLNPKGYKDDLGLLTRPIFFRDGDELMKFFPDGQVVIGTLWITMYHVARLARRDQTRLPAYFIQDFEPYFHPNAEKRLRDAIMRTYKWTDCSFAKTPWIVDQVTEAGGTVHLVPPALDLDLFYKRDAIEVHGEVVILTMLRPDTPQRGFDVAVTVLSELVLQRENIEIHAFGCEDSKLKNLQLPFEYVNHGVVENRDLPQLYSKSDIFAEFSHFHGFGRTIAEAMACETACVITDSGGIGMFAADNVNCLIASPRDINSLVDKLTRVIDDPELRGRLGKAGRETVKCFDRYESSSATLEFLGDCCKEKGKERKECQGVA